MNPFDDEDPPASKPTGEEIDHKELRFGMFKGKTPSQVAELGERGESWLRWAYTEMDRPPCSEALYRACGGKGKTKKEREAALAKPKKIASDDAYYPPAADDDIPF